MTEQATSTERPAGTVIIERIFDAPRDIVFRAWTDPAHLAKWWGPRGFTAPVCEVDARVGGELRIVMLGPDGNEYPMKGVFLEVVEPERLVFSNYPVDKDGNHLMEGQTTVTFADLGGKTGFHLHTHMVGLVDNASRMLAGMEIGWNQSIDCLEDLLANA